MASTVFVLELIFLAQLIHLPDANPLQVSLNTLASWPTVLLCCWLQTTHCLIAINVCLRQMTDIEFDVQDHATFQSKLASSYYFLLVINCDLSSISRRFRKWIATPLPHADPIRILPSDLSTSRLIKLTWAERCDVTNYISFTSNCICFLTVHGRSRPSTSVQIESPYDFLLVRYSTMRELENHPILVWAPNRRYPFEYLLTDLPYQTKRWDVISLL